jgi:phenylpropionate dioxygenase-like ring-hydroxylating dioxygenase large terminal subunit
MSDPSAHWTFARDLGLDRSWAETALHISPEIFVAEREHIYRRLWLMVGRVEDVPEPGAFFLRDVPMLNVEALVTRDREATLRAFYNTCSHRGTTIVNKRCGRALTFRCPYHSWLYGADGTLRAIPSPENFPDIDPRQHGLRPIHLDLWNGFIFLNFDPAPAPAQTLAEFLGGLGELHATLPFERYPFHIRMATEFAANWKSGMHTFMEGYHITTVHRKTLTPQVVSRENPCFHFYDTRLFGPHSTLTSERNYGWEPTTPVMKFAMAQMPPAVLPRARDPAERDFATHPSINRVGIPNFGVETITVFPNVCLQPLGGGYLWMEFWPIDAGRTRVEVRLHSKTPPSSLRQEFAASFGAVAARDVLSEDFGLSAMQQRGFAMGANQRQNFGENEALLRHFMQTVEHYLGSGVPLPSGTAPRQSPRTT